MTIRELRELLCEVQNQDATIQIEDIQMIIGLSQKRDDITRKISELQDEGCNAEWIKKTWVSAYRETSNDIRNFYR